MAIPFAALAMGAALGGGRQSTKVSNAITTNSSANVNPLIGVSVGGDFNGSTRGETAFDAPATALAAGQDFPQSFTMPGMGSGYDGTVYGDDFTGSGSDPIAAIFSDPLIMIAIVGAGAFLLLKGGK